MKLDRRNFLKLGAAGAPALIFPDRLRLAEVQRKPWNEQSAKVTRKHRNPRPTACTMCDNHCGLMSYREGDRVVMLLGQTGHPVANGKLCARAYGQLDRLYDPDRVLTPIMRDGDRGHGKWKKISWEAAYDLLRPRLEAAAAKDSNAPLAFFAGRDELLTEPFIGLFPGAARIDCHRSAVRRRFYRQVLGGETLRRDFRHCRFVLNFAADPLRTGDAFVTEVQALNESMRDNAMHLETVAGRLSQTGGRSRCWYPVEPRYYGDVARAIANIMLAEGWYSRKGLKDAGLAAGSLISTLAACDSATVVRTAGITEQQLRHLARQLWHRRPAVVIYDDEVFQTAGGWDDAMAIELLNVLAGAHDGGPGGITVDSGRLPGTAPAVSAATAVTPEWFFAGQGGRGGSTWTVMTCMANPVFDAFAGTAPEIFFRHRQRVDFHVAIDTHITETSRYADLVLPAATELESWGLFSRRLEDGSTCLALRQPVARPTDEILLLRKAKIKKLQLFEPSLAPVAESREFNQVALDLGRRLGRIDGPFVHEYVDEYLRSLVITIPGIAALGGLEYLKRNGFCRLPAATEVKRHAVGLQLTGGRATGIKPLDSDDFVLIPFAWHVLDSQTANCRYLAELRHDNPVMIHPRRARRLGIADGDTVQLITTNGSVKARVWLTETLHPGCAAMAVGHGHECGGRVAEAQPIAEHDPMTRELVSRKMFLFQPFTFRLRSWDPCEPLWWHRQGNGTHPNPLVTGRKLPQVPGVHVIEPLVRIRKG
ncbi:MAG: molybdopterin-dependent oxidoreductase [Deltaproteobacteria bacterium]|nr:molybdopterin-dependent oxidoreductase [Candidatus Anaeroferrophillacea bacterium]